MSAPPTSTPFVVIENGDAEAREVQAQSLQRGGFRVSTCPGPHHLRGGCPLAETGDCWLICHADAVVYDLDLDDDEDREVLWLLQARYPHVPVVVELPTSVALRNRHVLAGCNVIPPYSPEHLVDAVRAALDAG